MSATEPLSTDTALLDLLTAAPAACSTIAGATGWTVQPGNGEAGPEAGWRAVEATAGPMVLRLLVDPDLARHLQVGPPPAEDLVEGSTTPLQALAEALGHRGAITDVREVDPTRTDAIDLDRAAVVLVDDDAHRASFVILRPAAPKPTPAAPSGAPVAAAPRLTAVPSGLELLHDVELAVTVELGRTRMLVRDVLDLVPGSVIELDRAAGSPVDVLVNGTMIARGEVVVIDEEFGVRITEVIGHGDDPAR